MPYCKWTQDGNSLILSTRKGFWHFQMPGDWKIKNTHPDLFRLAEIVLLYPFMMNEMDGYTWIPSRRQGTHPGLSFSTGVDSTAAMLLMPDDTQFVYYRRDYASKINHANAWRMMEHIKPMVWCVDSDSELIRKEFAGLNHGFSSDYHCGVGLILLADYLDIGAFATGMVLESAYLYSGYKYRNFADTIYWQKWNRLFFACGLPIYQPVAGCSEIITEKIVAENNLQDYAISCLRGPEGQRCGECYKCFRKKMVDIGNFAISRDVDKIINSVPLKMASSLIHTMQKANPAGDKLPENLRHYLKYDVSWLEGYYPPALDLIPEKYRALTKSNLEKYCQPMQEPYEIHKWDVSNG